MLCIPAARLEVWNVVVPELRVPVPSVVVPSRKVTVPVGVPELDATVAVNVTAVPTTTVALDEANAVVVADRVGGDVVVLLLLDPQAIQNSTATKTIPSAAPGQRFRFLQPPTNIRPNRPMPPMLAKNIAECSLGVTFARSMPELEGIDGAVVEMVSVTVKGVLPFGVTDDGLKVQLTREGNVPQLNVIVPL